MGPYGPIWAHTGPYGLGGSGRPDPAGPGRAGHMNTRGPF